MAYLIDNQNFRRMQCSQCAVVYFFPDKLCDTMANEKTSWKCPNGHSQMFTESPAEKLRLERDRLRQQAVRLEDERREAEARAEKAERLLKRHKKRAAAGTCPCCKRTFKALAEHMKTQHPEFVAEAGANVVPLKRA